MIHNIGVQAVSMAFFSLEFSVQFTAAVVLFLLLVFANSTLKKASSDSPTSIPRNSLFIIGSFFRQRYSFMNWAFQATGQKIFQFQLLQNTVIVVSGESARESFFNAKSLDLTEGFKILSGAIPMVKGVTSDLNTQRIALIHKRLANIQRHAPLTNLIPRILEDSRKIMESWGPTGKFDPFDNIYELLFQTTIRSLSCSEIADNSVLVARLKKLYDTLDTGTTPATVLLPWLPTPAMLQKLWATKEIYDIVLWAINERQKGGIYQDDTLQMLLDFEDEKLVIIGFVMGLLIAGARATGTTASWLITFLSSHPEWNAKAASEVEYLLEHFSDCISTSQSLSSRLATIPLEIWENKTPILDDIIRETTRVAQPHIAMRRNMGEEFYISNKIIPSGAYVIYPFSDVHLDPKLYPDPWKFDPGRKPVTNAPFVYVGWGGGKTTCLGTRLAKLELKLITAMFVLGFHHSIVDATGNSPASFPIPNWNDTLLCRPSQGSFYIKQNRTSVPL